MLGLTGSDFHFLIKALISSWSLKTLRVVSALQTGVMWDQRTSMGVLALKKSWLLCCKDNKAWEMDHHRRCLSYRGYSFSWTPVAPDCVASRWPCSFEQSNLKYIHMSIDFFMKSNGLQKAFLNYLTWNAYS